jgi:antitoxin component HigA of HigAB toxin-antitoxin module
LKSRGPRSDESEILAGKRKLSVKHVEALTRFFKVNAAVFLDGR